MTEIIGNQEPARKLESNGKKDHLYGGTQKFLRIIVETVWRNKFKVSGSENIPAAGSAILAVNHSMHADPEFLMAGINRPMHFIGERDSKFNPIHVKATYFPYGVISSTNDMTKEQIKLFFKRIEEVVRNGELICTFPEGNLEKKHNRGEIEQFASGVVHIAREFNLPIIPVFMDGTQNVISNSIGKNIIQQLLRMHFAPVKIAIGKPIPAGEIQNAEQVRQAILGLKQQSSSVNIK